MGYIEVMLCETHSAEAKHKHVAVSDDWCDACRRGEDGADG